MDRHYAELRAEISGDTLAGHAAVYGQEGRVRDFYEVIAPGFFDKPLSEQRELAKSGKDAVFQVGHDGMPLGRTGNGTLRLTTDTQGLAFELDLPDTTLGRDVRVLTERGDLSFMSFGFQAAKDTWTKRGDGAQLRTLVEGRRLFDVSLVPHPTYAGATAALRNEHQRPTARVQAAMIRARLDERQRA